ncbi:hypothetical protein SAMN05880557_103220 [Pseudacidovorax sp. RU35E]|nr:hypothetical protein SAMN05880557_103220 [Pseudacidovorax sp. RU35E]
MGLCGLALPILLAGLAAAQPAAPVQTLRTAEAVVRVAGEPPLAAARVALPFRWADQAPRQAGGATLTLELPPLPAGGDDRLHGLLFEALGNQAAVYVGDRLVARWGQLGDPTFDAGRGPRLVRLPADLVEGAAAPLPLRIELSFQPQRGGGVSVVRWAPLAQLEALEARERLWRNTLSLVYAAGLLLMGGLAAGLWWYQRDPLYGCFSLAALAGTLRNLDQSGLQMPLPWPWWGAVVAMSYAVHIALLARFVTLALHQPSRAVLRLLSGILWTAVGLAGLAFALRLPALWTGALALLCGGGIAAVPGVLGDAVKGRHPTAHALLVAGLLAIAAGLHDLLRVRIGLGGASWVPLTPHAMFGFVLILAGMVVARYSRSVHEYRDLARSLDARVAERERQLTAAMDALQTQREQQAVLLERQRLMREIHDGVGSQLVGLLNLVGRPGADPAVMEAQVKLALDELRVAVDSLQPLEGDLTVVLATLRYRLQPRLEAAGLTLEWEVDSLPPRADVTPQTAMQIQRILLEGFTNVLRHAQARRIRLEAHWHAGPPERMEIVLADDGRGFAADGQPAGGQGLPSMRSRAAAIGATLTVASAPGEGAALRLDWPVRR